MRMLTRFSAAAKHRWKTVLPPLLNPTPVEEVGDRGTPNKLSCMLEQLSHPLQDTLTALGCSFPDRRRAKESYRNIYLPLLPPYHLPPAHLIPLSCNSSPHCARNKGLSCLTCSTGMDTQTPTLCRTELQLSPCCTGHCGPTGNPVTGRRDGVLSCCSAELRAKRDDQGTAAMSDASLLPCLVSPEAVFHFSFIGFL